ncbi:MAG: hypothetical protein U5K33_07975 [Halofilum sp. (in: g-proteobacteria)]|nr:hypothetical protein [Halofilum sp. (in: g-proteobacteria)]
MRTDSSASRSNTPPGWDSSTRTFCDLAVLADQQADQHIALDTLDLGPRGILQRRLTGRTRRLIHGVVGHHEILVRTERTLVQVLQLGHVEPGDRDVDAADRRIELGHRRRRLGRLLRRLGLLLLDDLLLLRLLALDLEAGLGVPRPRPSAASTVRSS